MLFENTTDPDLNARIVRWAALIGERSGEYDFVTKFMKGADVADYLANPQGRSTGAGPSGLPTLLLSALGRKSGEQRTTPLVFLQHGEDMIVVGSLAGYDTHPAWVLNVRANPQCWAQLDDNKIQVVARDVSDEERAALWPKLTELFPPWGYFQKQTDRPFAVVILSPAQ